MKPICLINSLGLVVYCVVMGCILYYRYWLKKNKKRVNDISSLISYDNKHGDHRQPRPFRMDYYTAAVIVRAFLLSILPGFIVALLILKLRSFCYPPDAIYRDGKLIYEIFFYVFVFVTIAAFAGFYIYFGYCSNIELQIGSIGFDGNNTKDFDRCRILRFRWLLFCFFFTGICLILR